MNTVATLPGDAAKVMQRSDWAILSKSLPAERTELQVHKLFYPSESTLRITPSAKRRRYFLTGYDDNGYWEVYQHILLSPDLCFPDLDRITRLSKEDGKILFLVMSHVVTWLNPSPTVITDRRDNNKPSLRIDLQPALQHFGKSQLRSAKRKVQADVSLGVERSAAENASAMMQQEILEFVCDQLEAFKSPAAKPYLDQMPHSDATNHYAARFSTHAWAGVRAIVCRYIANPQQYEWLTDAPGLRTATDFSGDGLKQVLDDVLDGIEGIIADSQLKPKIDSAVFRQQLISWLSEQYEAQPQTQLERPQAEDAGAPVHDPRNTVDTSASPVSNVVIVPSDDIREAAITRQNDMSLSPPDLSELRENLDSGSLPNAVSTDQGQQISAGATIDRPKRKDSAGAEVLARRHPLPAAREIPRESSGVAQSTLPNWMGGTHNQEKTTTTRINTTGIPANMNEKSRPKASWRKSHKAGK
jgi:hypothetical protein